MSKRKLDINDKIYIYYIKEYYSDSESSNLNDYYQILSNKSSFYITNENHSKFIEIKPSSLTKIFLNSQLEPNEHILFCFYKDILPSQSITEEKNKNKEEKSSNYKNKLRSRKKSKKKEDEKVNEDAILDVSNQDILDHSDEDEKGKNKFNNKNSYNDNKNETLYDQEINLLTIKTNENLIKIDEHQNNYLLSINNINITNDNLKCFYLSLFFCGLIYIIYCFDVLIDKNKSFKDLFNASSFILGALLIFTGIYGYSKINKKIYYDKICIFLTYICFIMPFLSFIFSRFSNENYIRKNFVMSIFINLIAAFFAGICAYILYELNKKDKKGLLFEKVNIA